MSFTQYIARPTDTATASVLDFSHLNRLKEGVKDGADAPQAEQKKVAQQFESLLIQQLLKQARQASGTNGLLDSDQTRLAQSMGDEQMALQLADPGLGLAQALLDQMQLNKAGSLSDAKRHGKEMPELASSRLPGLRSRIGEERTNVASSISSLIDMLTNTSVGQATGAAFSAIKGAPQHIERFVATMTNAANVASSQSGVPAKLILSQAALESGWGRREIKGEDGATSHNLFGIKASPNWKGKVVNVLTTEFENGIAKKVVQPFRAYGSYAESFADYARLISQNERYSDVVGAPSAEVAAHRIQAAGYATDPKYAEKLISIMAYFNKQPA